MKLYIGENLKRLRLAKGLTQEQLADEIGASVQSVSRWEVNTSYPDVEMIPVIALYFGVSTDELMGVNCAAREERLKKDWEKKLSPCRSFQDASFCQAGINLLYIDHSGDVFPCACAKQFANSTRICNIKELGLMEKYIDAFNEIPFHEKCLNEH